MNEQVSPAASTLRLFAGLLVASVLAGCVKDVELGSSAPTISLAVDPAAIALGQDATLTWSSSGGATCDASGDWSGVKAPMGAAGVTPIATGTLVYTLTCSAGGHASIKTARLTVVPASAYTVTSLVEDAVGGAAPTTDSLLVNPWGLAFGPVSATWAVNNHGDTATIYDGNGRPSPLIVHFPAGAGGAAFGGTGIVYNGTSDFVVASASQSGPARFIFAGESGMLAGWTPGLDVTNAISAYAATDGAVYKSLALATNIDGNFLYAADFANGKIDVFDGTFAKQAPTPARFAFEDPTLPAGYAPFGLQAVAAGPVTLIYVSYAKHDEAEPDDDAPGPGLGLIDIFDTNGRLLEHLVAEGGKLNAPWGMALAPPDFGTLSNALLVGNFGDGTIHGYDPLSGRYRGAVTDGGVTPLAVPGLWGLQFGNDAVNQPHSTLFFAAGTDGETHGRYGRIDLGPFPPVLGEIPYVTLTAPSAVVSGRVSLTATAQGSAAVTKVQFFVDGTLLGTATQEPFTVEWDTRAVSDGEVTLRAVATDANGDVGSSGLVIVTVANGPQGVHAIRVASELPASLATIRPREPAPPPA